MKETVKSYRIKANPGCDENIKVSLDQDYNVFEILSLKLDDANNFKHHSSNYGIIVGRVTANGGFGVPNAKVSIFIEADSDTLYDSVMSELYPFTSALDRNSKGSRYNLLPDYKVQKCHQAIGNIPSKEFILDNDVVLEIFDKYYKFTTRTNNSGDYCISGVPVGQHNIHMDIDLSDCGILSQRPRDFVYKGYNIEQFENPNQFKKDPEIDKLSQVFSQTKVVNVIPFWGNEDLSAEIGITRTDFEIAFKFEPTCVFMGCIVGDGKSNGISKRCVPTNNMGAMDELVSGEGTIEMIRKNINGEVEEFQIKGTELINANGVWCYQIPMNLDYMVTDEYGNMVPSDEPLKGIPTRARVRFRFSMHDFEKTTEPYFRSKILVPNNPDALESKDENVETLDYNFGTNTNEMSFRDLYWDNVYTVKSYIPRFQKSKKVKEERFTGIKHCNKHGSNNPIPYNNIRIRLPFMFTLMCAIIKSYIRIVGFVNKVIYAFVTIMVALLKKDRIEKEEPGYVVLADGLCPELDNWYFAPKAKPRSGNNKKLHRDLPILQYTFNAIVNENGSTNLSYDDGRDLVDSTSVDWKNKESDEQICLTNDIEYLLSCVEMNLAQEYNVINFDFYNDWINGVLYFPRWARVIRKKTKFFFGLITLKEKTRGCMSDPTIFGRTRYYTQQCSLSYGLDSASKTYTKVNTPFGCVKKSKKKEKMDCHKNSGMRQLRIFGNNGGIVQEEYTMYGQNVYYMRPCEFLGNNRKVNLFATDIVLLGSLKECNNYGLPQAYKWLTSSSYQMPTNLALTNLDDSGYLYANNNSGTICSGKGYGPSVNVKSNEGEQSFKNAENITSTSSEPLTYSGLDDTMPLTEASGIAWNYDGPGQESQSFAEKYFPGGHFLGISCNNAQTNVKSCINLQRICEAGVNMSTRIERPREIDSNGNILHYYMVPTGFISKEEIVGEGFRTAFSTMNMEKLIAKTTDKDTGFLRYKFTYSNPLNFDGAFRDFDGSSKYNEVLKLEKYDDLSSEGTGRTEAGKDTDKDEKVATIKRTIEDVSKDYYYFRLGITSEEDINNYGRNKFADVNGSTVSLPQYQNSFYFYFGIKDGATALDEFHTQFFSECQEPDPDKKAPQIQIMKGDLDFCDMTQDVTIIFSNMSFPVDVTISPLDNENDFDKKSIKTQKNIVGFYKNPFGNYLINLTDSNGIIVEKNITLGFSEVTVNTESDDFRVKTAKVESKQDAVENLILGLDANDRSDIGGFIKTDGNVYLDYNVVNVLNSEGMTIPGVGNVSFIVTDGKYFVSNFYDKEKNINYPEFLNSEDELIADGFKAGNSIVSSKYNGKEQIHLWNSSKIYNIYIGIKSNREDCKYGRYNYFKIYSCKINGPEGFEMYLGCKLLPFDNVMRFEKKWWEESNQFPLTDSFSVGTFFGDYSSLKNIGIEEQQLAIWALKHFKTLKSLDCHELFDFNIEVLNSDKNFSTIESGIPEKFDGKTGNVDLFDTVCSTDYSSEYSGYDLSDESSSYPNIWPREYSNMPAVEYRKKFGNGEMDFLVELKFTRDDFAKIAFLPNFTVKGINCCDVETVTWYGSDKRLDVTASVGSDIRDNDLNRVFYLVFNNQKCVSSRLIKIGPARILFSFYDETGELANLDADKNFKFKAKELKIFKPYRFNNLYSPIYSGCKISEMSQSCYALKKSYSSEYDFIELINTGFEFSSGREIYFSAGIHNQIGYREGLKKNGIDISNCKYAPIEHPYRIEYSGDDENEKIFDLLPTPVSQDNIKGFYKGPKYDIGFYGFYNMVNEAAGIGYKYKKSIDDILSKRSPYKIVFSEDGPVEALSGNDDIFSPISGQSELRTDEFEFDGGLATIFTSGPDKTHPIVYGYEDNENCSYYLINKDDTDFKYPFVDDNSSDSAIIFFPILTKVPTPPDFDDVEYTWFRLNYGQIESYSIQKDKVIVPILTFDGPKIIGIKAVPGKSEYVAYCNGENSPISSGALSSSGELFDEIDNICAENFGKNFTYVYNVHTPEKRDDKDASSDIFRNGTPIEPLLKTKKQVFIEDGELVDKDNNKVYLDSSHYILGVEKPSEYSSETIDTVNKIVAYPNLPYKNTLS